VRTTEGKKALYEWQLAALLVEEPSEIVSFQSFETSFHTFTTSSDIISYLAAGIVSK